MNLTQKSLFLLTLSILISSCIKIYEPALESSDKSNYVISALVTNQEGYQYVSISKSSPISKPSANPLSGCNVKIIDNNGNIYYLEEYKSGKYRVWMNQSDLILGKAYMIDINTPLDEHLSSDFDILNSGGQIDSIYYSRENIPTADSIPNDFIKGIRFFINSHGTETSSRYYKMGTRRNLGISCR